MQREYTMYPGIDAPHSLRVWSGATPGSANYYVMEQPGHVTGLVNSSSQVANEYRYTPWGQTESTSETVVQPLRFMARELDATTGLYYVRARWYDPGLARFNSEDPVGLPGGVNGYTYSGNNPVGNIDPTGKWCEVRGIGTQSESLQCEDITPGDYSTIRNYLGGDVGAAASDLFALAGWIVRDATRPLSPSEEARLSCVFNRYLSPEPRRIAAAFLSSGWTEVGRVFNQNAEAAAWVRTSTTPMVMVQLSTPNASFDARP